MDNIKYYILAYIELIYLFLEKYVILLYLLCKIKLTNKTKNVDIFCDANDNMDYRLERRYFVPNSIIHEIYSIGYQKKLFNVSICTTNKYILIRLKEVTDVFKKEYSYKNGTKKFIFSKRDLLEEKSDCTMYDMVTRNIEYYFKKKNSIVYEKNFNNGRRHRLLYKVR